MRDRNRLRKENARARVYVLSLSLFSPCICSLYRLMMPRSLARSHSTLDFRARSTFDTAYFAHKMNASFASRLVAVFSSHMFDLKVITGRHQDFHTHTHAGIIENRLAPLTYIAHTYKNSCATCFGCT